MHAPMHARTDGRTTRKHNTAAGNIKKLVALLVGNYFTKTAHPSPQQKGVSIGLLEAAWLRHLQHRQPS